MKSLLLKFLSLFTSGTVISLTPQIVAAEGFYDLNAMDITGKSVQLAEYRGKVSLVVNTASRCGFTSQYEGLEKLYDTYKQRGFVVLGFPSNDFMQQEPGTDLEIKDFCKLNYDVSFPLFSKASVKGSEKQAVLKFLTEQSAEPLQGEVRWNFEKFLVNQEGMLVGRWRSATDPQHREIIDAIEKLLALPLEAAKS
jgi:glutathione peroxidase